MATNHFTPYYQSYNSNFCVTPSGPTLNLSRLQISTAEVAPRSFRPPFPVADLVSHPFCLLASWRAHLLLTAKGVSNVAQLPSSLDLDQKSSYSLHYHPATVG